MANKFEGLWIPRSILLSQDMSAAEKIIAAEIAALQRSRGCFVRNAHLARLVSVGERQVRTYTSRLRDCGILVGENVTSEQRRLWVAAEVLQRQHPDEFRDAAIVAETGTATAVEAVTMPALATASADEDGRQDAARRMPSATSIAPNLPNGRQDPSGQGGKIVPGSMGENVPVTGKKSPTEIILRTQGENTTQTTREGETRVGETDTRLRRHGVFEFLHERTWESWLRNLWRNHRVRPDPELESDYLRKMQELQYDGYDVNNVVFWAAHRRHENFWDSPEESARITRH